MPYSLTGLIVLAASLSFVLRAQAAEEPAQPVQAIWKPQEITFHLQTFTTFYACDALERKLRHLLRELGVTGRVRVSDPDCPSIARLPNVRLRVTSPVAATPEALAERDKDKSIRELAARVNGKQAEEKLQEEQAQIPAQWRRVSLSRGKLDLASGDCELIEELKKKVLPKLAVRIVKDNLHCTPHQITLSQPQLEVEALVALPKPDDPAQKKDDESRLEVTLDPR